MKKILINYNFNPDKSWIGDNYLIYDRSDDGIDHLDEFDKSKIIKSTNTGQVDYDKLSYLVDNYWNLPEIFVWGKTNIGKYVSKEQIDNLDSYTDFTPLLRQDHKQYADKFGRPVAYYAEGIYHEINNSWYVSELGSLHFPSFKEWASHFYIPCPSYIPFAPGGNYILTRERVHRYGVDLYDEMRRMLPYAQNPAEAHFAERSYYLLWK